jgi:hypothetical protein
MATFNKFNSFVEAVGRKLHNLNADSLRVALSNTAPVATQTVLDLVTNHPPPAAANGYPTGGNTPTNSGYSQAAGVGKLTLVDTVFTATAGGIGPFRYAILYNDTASNKELIGWYDYGSSITLASGETLTVDFDGTNGVLTIT